MEQQEQQKQEIKTIKHALLVEDYLLSQKFMTHYLYQLDYQVDLVVDSLTAIQNIQSKTYDLIIEDVNLHGCISGEKVIQEIRESKLNVGTPVIVWSAYVNANGEEQYLAWGADAALIKNCGFEGLEDAIWKCSLTPRNEREFYYKLKIFQQKWQENCPGEWVKKINDLRHTLLYP